MRRDPTYWHDVTDKLLHAAWRLIPAADVSRKSKGRYYEVLDAALLAGRIRDHMERKHAGPY